MTDGCARPAMIRPGLFSIQAHADTRRHEFDLQNEMLVARGIRPDLVFVGDSITQNWELQAYFAAKGLIAVNRGIGGDQSSFMRRRFEADALQLRPAWAVVHIGINDTWIMEEQPPSAFNTPEAIFDRYRENMLQVLESAAERNQRLMLASLLPTNIPGRRNADRNRLIVRINAWLRSCENRENRFYADYHSRFAAADGLTLRDGLADDGLHPHVAGYDLMAAVVGDGWAAGSDRAKEEER